MATMLRKKMIDEIDTSSLNSYFICHWCNKKLSKRFCIQRHMKTCKVGILSDPINKIARATPIINKKKNILNSINKCEVCSKRYPNMTSLRLHMRKKHFDLYSELQKEDIDTSRLNDCFKCHWCNGMFLKRRSLVSHLKKCEPNRNRRIGKKTESLSCQYSKIIMGNRASVIQHIANHHGNDRKSSEDDVEKEKPIDDSVTKSTEELDSKEEKRSETIKNASVTNKSNSRKIQPNSPLKKCEVCNETCPNMTRLRLHIRKEHFNLQAKIPYCNQKRVNQVWFEKVLNCNNIMEIRKTGPNTLLMRKMDENTAIKVYENHTAIIDLSDIYPTNQT